MNKNFGKITVINDNQRKMNHWDMFATWIGANANNGTWYIGGVIAAAGLWTSSLALVTAGIISYIILGLASYMGFKTGLPAMALTRASFGLRGSFIPSIINVIQFIGWTAANTFIAAISISVILHDIFGFKTYQQHGLLGISIGILIMGLLHLCSISLGQRSVQLIERIGIILVIIFVIWESIVVFKQVSFAQIANWQPKVIVKLSFGNALDILAAFNLAWVTAAADFSRFAAKKTAATVTPFLGASLGLFWFAFIGIFATIATALSLNVYDPNNSDPSTIASKLGLGVIALIVIVITSTTANAVNLMAAGSALTNFTKKINLNQALWIVTIIATIVSFIPLFFATFLDAFTQFLDLVGMFLGPEIAIFLTDYFLLKNQKYDISAFTKIAGQYWYDKGVNIIALLSWLLGLGVFFIFSMLPIIKDTIGATFPTMLVTSIVYLIISKINTKD
ncbi:cytosine permease [Periweissella beninensis]|uniref:cytosine permease n=1 Tax=Periweissella beninensis TaxID=504936 RepID=UPI0021A2D08A|nr:cytosine permease [Periweissella beninensis]MCT4395766.1 cytosine permease [Periweissella beninensis]